MECNGQNDCRDNSDEIRCEDVSSTTIRVPSSSVASPSASEECDDDQFLCKSGACISMDKVLFISNSFNVDFKQSFVIDNVWVSSHF